MDNLNFIVVECNVYRLPGKGWGWKKITVLAKCSAKGQPPPFLGLYGVFSQKM